MILLINYQNCDLLSKFYVNDYPKSAKLPILSDFKLLLREMRSIHTDEDSLKILFKLAVKLLKYSKDMIFYFRILILFGSETHLKQKGEGMSTQRVSNNILQKIIIAIFEANDMHEDLHKAFAMYIDAHKLNRQMENINFNITKKANN